MSDTDPPHFDRSAIADLLKSAGDTAAFDEEQSLDLASQAYELAEAYGLSDAMGQANLLRGRIYAARQDSAKAVPVLLSALQSFEDVHNEDGKGSVLELLGRLYLTLGELPTALRYLRSALDSAIEQGDPKSQATAQNLLAGVFHRIGVFDEALSHLNNARSLYKHINDELAEANVLSNIGLLYTSKGFYTEALTHLINAHEILKAKYSSEKIYINVLTNLGHLYATLNEQLKSLEFFAEVRDRSISNNDRYMQAIANLNIGEVNNKLNRTIEAEEAFSRAKLLFGSINSRWGEANALNGLGSIYFDRGQLDEATAAHHEAAAIANEVGDIEIKLTALIAIGKICKKKGELFRATESFLEALELAEASNNPACKSDAHLALSEVYVELGDFKEAFEHHKAYHAQDKELFNAESDKHTRELTARFDVERARHEAEVQRVRREAAEDAKAKAEALVRERTRELEQAQIEVVTRLAAAGESRDDITGEHTWRVGHLAALVAQELGWTHEEVALLRIAARLHDVGKIGIPDAILRKPGKYTPEEYEHMKQHTIIGGRILSGGQSRLLRLAEEIALSHHERWDGMGYPYGKAGEDIPLAGRIVAVVDVFDALLQERPYKRAWSHDEACAELRRSAGSHFDPVVVDAALRIITRHDFSRLMRNDDGTPTGTTRSHAWEAVLLPPIGSDVP